uniref:Lipase maturation factor 1 n=1 Tax=Naja naja TaxID=35670 RepID=A0A8C6Y7E4_NAJNA
MAVNSGGELRRRLGGPAGDAPDRPREPCAPPAPPLRPGSFWLTRLVLLRATAFIYFVAFLVAYHQNKALIGDQGLLPCKLYLENVKRHFKGRINMETLSYAPTLIWFLDWSSMDSILDAFALIGLAISAFVLVTGCANMILMAALWMIYLSLINVGQIWYSFGHGCPINIATWLFLWDEHLWNGVGVGMDFQREKLQTTAPGAPLRGP